MTQTRPQTHTALSTPAKHRGWLIKRGSNLLRNYSARTAPSGSGMPLNSREQRDLEQLNTHESGKYLTRRCFAQHFAERLLKLRVSTQELAGRLSAKHP